jgi:hypothetical protein
LHRESFQTYPAQLMPLFVSTTTTTLNSQDDLLERISLLVFRFRLRFRYWREGMFLSLAVYPTLFMWGPQGSRD